MFLNVKSIITANQVEEQWLLRLNSFYQAGIRVNSQDAKPWSRLLERPQPFTFYTSWEKFKRHRSLKWYHIVFWGKLLLVIINLFSLLIHLLTSNKLICVCFQFVLALIFEKNKNRKLFVTRLARVFPFLEVTGFPHFYSRRKFTGYILSATLYKSISKNLQESLGSTYRALY